MASWGVPTDYLGDAPEALARLQAAAEGDIWPLGRQIITRLGAPFGADWSDYPAPDKPLMLALGGLATAIGVYAAANLGLVLAQVTAALAFYGVARWLRVRWEWAAAGGLLFAYTYHTFHRGLAHFSLVFTWTVPLGLAAVWLVASSRRLEWRRPGALLCLGAAVALGTFNPYNLLFWLQLMAWGLVWQWFGARRRANLTIGLASLAAALAAFVVAHAEVWLHAPPDAQPLLARNYGGTEVYALKPIEMFIPPAYHHWDFLAFFGHRYARWSPWRGEAFLPYLGLVGIAGFVLLAILSVRRLVARRAPPAPALATGWLVSYASVGGVGNLLALFAGFQVFRATNRAAIFISAIVLFFLVGRLSRWTAGWRVLPRCAAAIALAGFGVFEQLPRLEPELNPRAIASAVDEDREFGRLLEAALPPRSLVFQLPVVAFPEARAPHQLGEYDHFRPYLATRTLRFSFGAPKLRPASRWQRELDSAPVPELVRRLERHGFAALYLNRKGFADGGDHLLRELAALGYARQLRSPNGEQIAVLLQPATRPEPPVAAALTFGRGWHAAADDGWRWAYGDGALAYFNPYAAPVTAALRLRLAAATPRTVHLEHKGRVALTAEAGAPPGVLVEVRLELDPGVNTFKLRSDQPATRQGDGRHPLRAFAIEEKSVHVTIKPARSRPSGYARLEQP